MVEINLWFLTSMWAVAVGVAGWFLNNLQKDVKAMLLNQEKVAANILEFARDMIFIKSELSEHNKRLAHVETSIARIEEWKKQF